ncbi:discoidin domain-containing protein [Candidatus Sumerlaeota bacterium]|nr:discoidin domain-containing protein [Candidatus Sumerlaeota bacterium]
MRSPALALISLSLMTLGHVLAAPLPQVTTRGNEFVIGDQAFRFVGVNLRGIAHYGEGDVLIYTVPAHRTENLDGVVAMGGQVIRIFAPIPSPNLGPGLTTTEELIERLTVLLDQCEARGIYAIVALTDFYHASGFRVPGDDVYYTGGYLNSAFFSGGYLVNYLPWVQAAVTALQDHSAVFAWEIGNELTAYTGGVPEDIYPFVADVADEIQAIDTDTMVAFGGLSVQHLGVVPRDGGQTLAMFDDPNIDFVTVHIYNDDFSGDVTDTFAVAYAVDKPIIVEETGLDSSIFSNRPATLATELASWMDTWEARGVMQWGFQTQTYDIGDGDGIFGMDPNFFAFDWDGMNATYLARANLIAASPVTVPEIVLPAGDNVAADAVGWSSSGDFSGSYGPDKAIDGIISEASKWTSNGSSPTSWMALDLGGLHTINGAIVRSAGAAHERVIYNTVAFEVQTGPTLTGPWTTRFSHSDTHAPSRVVCNFAAPVDARCVRLLITDAGIDNYARIPEFEVYGTDTVPAELTGFEMR